jgi:hypothetical protein
MRHVGPPVLIDKEDKVMNPSPLADAKRAIAGSPLVLPEQQVVRGHHLMLAFALGGGDLGQDGLLLLRSHYRSHANLTHRINHISVTVSSSS